MWKSCALVYDHVTMFACKLCGKTYEGIPSVAPAFAAEEVETRRQAWLAAEEKLDKAPDNEHFVKAHQKAWFAYMATKSSGVEKLPDDLMAAKAPERVSYAVDIVDKDGPQKVVVEKSVTSMFLRCAKRHVLVEPMQAAVFSYGMIREMRLMPAGEYNPKTITINHLGETVALFSEGEIIVATHWGPTPFAKAFQLRDPEPAKVKEEAA
jgi:hypothetical protein